MGELSFPNRGCDPIECEKAMTGIRNNRSWRWPAVIALLVLSGCGRAPSFDVLGSFFPAWLVCLAAAVLLTFLVRWLSSRLRITLAPPILIYPSLGAFFTFVLWLILFH
jgi:hypothetical protein